jgi:uncharacterized protein (TIRG00374 family)
VKNIISKTSKVLTGILVGAVFCYFAFSRVNLSKIYELILDVKLIYVFVALLTILVAQILRSIRWGIMLHPIEPLSQKLLFPITSIGFMFIMLFPARLGELVRPYLLHQNSQVNINTAMATIVLERILDAIFILTFFMIIVSALEVPSWIVHGAVFIIITIITVIGFLFLGTLKWTKHHFNRIIYKFLSQRVADFVGASLKKFYKGMAVLGKGRHALIIVSLTACIWSSLVLSHLFLFGALQIHLGAFAALTVLTLTVLGISVPAGPGFIGNFHFFCILGLSMFGVDKDMALSYALVNHALIMLTLILLGVICMNLPGLNLGFKFLKTSFVSEQRQK